MWARRRPSSSNSVIANDRRNLAPKFAVAVAIAVTKAELPLASSLFGTFVHGRSFKRDPADHTVPGLPENSAPLIASVAFSVGLRDCLGAHFQTRTRAAIQEQQAGGILMKF